MLEQSVRGSQRDVCKVYARRIAFSGDETVRVAVGLAAYEYARHLRAPSYRLQRCATLLRGRHRKYSDYTVLQPAAN